MDAILIITGFIKRNKANPNYNLFFNGAMYVLALYITLILWSICRKTDLQFKGNAVRHVRSQGHFHTYMDNCTVIVMYTNNGMANA